MNNLFSAYEFPMRGGRRFDSNAISNMAGPEDSVADLVANDLSPDAHMDSDVIDSPLKIEDDGEVTPPANLLNKNKSTTREVEGSAGPSDDEDYDDETSGSGSGTDAPEDVQTDVSGKKTEPAPTEQVAKDKKMGPWKF